MIVITTVILLGIRAPEEHSLAVRLVRQITTVGNSVGVTLPRELLDAYGLQKGALVEVRAIGMGLLLRPLRLTSTRKASQRGRRGRRGRYEE